MAEGKIPIGQYRPLELGEFSSKFKLPSKENVVIAGTTGRRGFHGVWHFGGSSSLVIRGGLPGTVSPPLLPKLV